MGDDGERDILVVCMVTEHVAMIELDFKEGDWVKVSEDAPLKMAKKGWSTGLKPTLGKVGMFVEEVVAGGRFCVVDFSMTPGIEHLGRRVLLGSCLSSSQPLDEISFDEVLPPPAEYTHQTVKEEVQVPRVSIDDEIAKLEKQLKELFLKASDAQRAYSLEGENQYSKILQEIVQLQATINQLKARWSQADVLDDVQTEQRIGFPLRSPEDVRIIDPRGEQQEKIRQISQAIAARSLRKERLQERVEEKHRQPATALPGVEQPGNNLVDYIKSGDQARSFQEAMREVGAEIYEKYRENRRRKMSGEEGGEQRGDEPSYDDDDEEEGAENEEIMSILRNIPGLQDGSFDSVRRDASKGGDSKPRWSPSSPPIWNSFRLPPNVYSGEVEKVLDRAEVPVSQKCPAAAEEALQNGMLKYSNKKSREDVLDHLWKIKGELVRELHERSRKEMLVRLSRNTKTYPPGTRWIVDGKPLVKRRYDEREDKWVEYEGEEEEVAFSITWEDKVFIFPPNSMHGEEEALSSMTLSSVWQEAKEFEMFLNNTHGPSIRSTALRLRDRCMTCLDFIDKELTLARERNDVIFMELEGAMRHLSRLHVKLNFVYETASRPTFTEAEEDRKSVLAIEEVGAFAVSWMQGLKVDGNEQRQGLELLSISSSILDERAMAMDALTVLKYLSEDEQRRREIAARGGIEATVKAAGLRVLVNLSQEKQGVRKMCAA
ncbi:hypothetical protein GUITHDRAFT_140757 [Guillardia theta CCMP2712]|uniref:Uncharacterized protein n=2 Tax=Guillardia theta TaxID=55529 RepID=L1J3T8_GUITC|nr:hypothetical protein GUITHDRAFT_140757 [Guillardia theta CCMP2712]EKX43193.1 hypothetical protein GUITHDRAFT_140757 [Guillardia theta CCMP2712]|eukprot:XP_005830173.1 hypothetical protein GUITHDRAFT_140757 [Guillardia theta CCMP2712]